MFSSREPLSCSAFVQGRPSNRRFQKNGDDLSHTLPLVFRSSEGRDFVAILCQNCLDNVGRAVLQCCRYVVIGSLNAIRSIGVCRSCKTTAHPRQAGGRWLKSSIAHWNKRSLLGELAFVPADRLG